MSISDPERIVRSFASPLAGVRSPVIIRCPTVPTPAALNARKRALKTVIKEREDRSCLHLERATEADLPHGKSAS